MGMTVFDLVATLRLDSSEYESGLGKAKGVASSFGSALKNVIGIQLIEKGIKAVGDFAKASVQAGMNFDTSMSQVAATMGKTMEEMENEVGKVTLHLNGQVQEFEGNLRDFAQTMGKNTKFSATECADALNYMALAGYDAQTSMEMLPNVLNLAAAGAMDLARASDMVTDAQTALGLSLDRTNLFVDELAKSASTGNTSVEQLGDAFLVVGGLAQELNGGMIQVKDGVDIAIDGTQELEVAFTAMANAGIKGSEAGTHMRNLIMKLAKPTKEGADVMEELGINVFDTEGNMRSLADIMGDTQSALENLTQEEKIKAIGSMFNSRDLASTEALLNAVNQDWNEIGTSILDAKIDLDTVTEAVQNTGVDLSQYGDSVLLNYENIAADIREALSTSGLSVAEATAQIADSFEINFSDAQKMVMAVDSELQKASGSAQEMADTQLDNLEGDITIFKSALEGAQIVISDQLSPTLREFVQFGTDGISSLTDAFQQGGLSGAMGELGNLLAEGTKMIVSKLPEIAGGAFDLITAFGQGIIDNLPLIEETAVTIVTDLGERIRDNADKITPACKEIILSLAKIVTDNLPTLIELGTEILLGMIEGMTEAYPEFIEVLPAIIDAILSQIPQIVVAALQIGPALFAGLIQCIPVIVQAIPQIIQSLVTMMIGGDSVVQIIDGTIQLFMAMLDALPDIIDMVVEMIPAIIEAIITALIDAMPQLAEAGVKLFGALIQAAPKITALILTLTPRIITALYNGFVKGMPKMKESAVQMMKGFLDAFPNFISQLGSTISNVVSNMVAHFKAGVGALTQVGRDLLVGLWNGISDKVQWVYTQIRSFGGNVLKKLKEALHEESPSKATREMGQFLAEGLALGWDDEIDDVNKEIDKKLKYKGEIDVTKTTKTTDDSAENSKHLKSALKDVIGDMTIILNNTTKLDSKVLNKESYKYTLSQLGADTRAQKVAMGVH